MAEDGKIPNPNLRRGGGRPKGSLNKTTRTAKSLISDVADRLGGANRMLEWVKEAPENEKAFWTQVYPKLLPVQVHGDSENPIAVALIERRIVKAGD